MSADGLQRGAVEDVEQVGQVGGACREPPFELVAVGRHHAAGRDLILAQPLRGISTTDRLALACIIAFQREKVKPEREPTLAALEEKLGKPVQFYCYPSGRYTDTTIALLRANGFRAAVTIAYGATHTAGGVFELDRVRVRGADTLEQFIIKVETAP